MGYSPLHHWYRCFESITDRIYIIRHVRFNDEVFPFHSHLPSPSNPNTSPIYVFTFPTHVASTPELYLEAPTTNENDTPTPTSSTSPPPPPPPPRSQSSNVRQNLKRKTPYSPSAYTTTVPSTPFTEPTSFSAVNMFLELHKAMFD